MNKNDDGSDRRGPIAWMAQNSVAANLLMLVFILGGLLLSTQVKQEVFPEFSSDIVRITVPYPGASPEEVEQGIVLAIEDRVRGLEGVKRVTSTANEGLGTVVVELLISADISKAFQDIKNEVDGITSFPEDAESPVVSLVDIRKRVVTLLLYGEQDPKDLRSLAERVRDDLVQQPGVTLVELGLTPPLEIAIEVSQENLRKFNLTLNQIADIVRRTALELPGGEVRTQGGRILLRTQERRDYGRQFLDIPVTTDPNGALVVLGDIAQVRDGFSESDEEALFNGKPAVTIEVFRVGDETPQSVSGTVAKYIEALRPEIPENVQMLIWEDSSETYRDRMGLLLKNAVLGLSLVLLLLGCFLEVRLAFWVTLGIPISILGCFLFIPFTGASINMISLFAFIITLGIIVDDAVVMGENIYERREQGLPPLNAAIAGARDIFGPITFAVLTNIVAFMPLFFVPGISGKFFRQIPAIVVGVFIVSLIESIFILPSHLSHKQYDRKIWRILNTPREYCSVFLRRCIEDYYTPFVDNAIRYRYITIAIAIAALLTALGAVRGGYIQFRFLPKIDADIVSAQATLPFGAPLTQSRSIQQKLIAAAERTIEKTGGQRITKGIYSQIGGGLIAGGPGPSLRGANGSHIIAAQVSLVPSDERTISASEFSRVWRRELGKVVGLETLQFRYDTGASEGSPIELNLTHRSREVSEEAAKELGKMLESYAGVFDIDDGVEGGKRQLSFQVTPYARSLGITAQDLGRQVRASFFGAEALRQQRGRNEMKIMVRLPLEERKTLRTVDELVIRTPNGGEIPFLEAAEIEEGRSYTQIDRRDGRRVVTVTADVDDTVSNANQIIGQVVDNDIALLQKKYPGLVFSFGGEQEAQRESIGVLFVGFLFALLGIYALLAVPFRSYVQPIIVMLSIPFGMIGAILGHFLLGYGLSIISMFGLIALSGVVVNDSLVLVVTANALRDDGHSTYDSIRLAGVRRFRPIILTSLTTFLGLMPMIFETSMQARFLIPMAISLGFGILASTVIILALVPAVYMMVDDVSSFLDGVFGRYFHEDHQEPTGT